LEQTWLRYAAQGGCYLAFLERRGIAFEEIEGLLIEGEYLDMIDNRDGGSQ